MIGIIGGTGPQGQGLAYRLAMAGVDVMIGSRKADKGRAAAEGLQHLGSGRVEGGANGELPGRSDMLLVAVPHEGMADTLGPLADQVTGQVVMSAVNHLGFAGGPHLVSVPAGSSAQEVAELLPGGKVTTAFNNVSAVHLMDTDHVFDEDVLVCGDDPGAVAQTIDLVDRLDGLRGVNAGPLSHAATIEAVTAVLISVNKAHKVNAGVRIVGL